MQIAERHLKELKSILSKYPYTFYAFGSRVTGEAKKFSDLDICYKEKIPDRIVVEIEEDLEESDLPFKVELIDWNLCALEFRQAIENDLQVI